MADSGHFLYITLTLEKHLNGAMYSLDIAVLYSRREPHELFLTKGVPWQIPAGLEILKKFVLAWRFEQFEEHLF